jgi:hypothetical protein
MFNLLLNFKKMATCLNYNCEELTPHEASSLNCKGPRPGGISELVLILCGAGDIDPTDGTEVNALIASGDAVLVSSVAMGLNVGEPTLSPKTTACGLPQTLFVTYSGTITDYSWNTSNFEFWNTLTSGYTVQGAIARMCPKTGYDDQSVFLDGEISFGGGAVIENTDETPARFDITFTYKGDVELIATPAGVFA